MSRAYLTSAVTLLLLTGAIVAEARALWPEPQPPTQPPLTIRVHEGHAGAARASGVVNTVDVAQRKVNVSHGSIKQLGWPAMTMDFPVSEDVDLTAIKPGMRINFTLVKGAGGAWTVDTAKPSGTR